MVTSGAASLVRRFPHLDALSFAAAEEFRRFVEETVRERGRCRIVLPGGNTPRRLFEILATPAFLGSVPWPRLEFFWGDERMVPPDDPDSNFRMANEILLTTAPVNKSAVYRVHTECGSPDEVARGYAAEISHSLGLPRGGAPPEFDLVMLGMGADGHTASLFPHSSALGTHGQWVVTSRAPKRPYERITMTAEVLNAAREVIFLVSGSDKAAVLARVLEGPANPQQLPAQLIVPSTGRLLWFVDSAAASELTLAGQHGRFRV